MPELTEDTKRLRRIETRVTQLAIALGIPTRAQKPAFDPEKASVVVPSMHSSLQEILDSIPEGWHRPVTVRIGGRNVLDVRVPGTETG